MKQLFTAFAILGMFTIVGGCKRSADKKQESDTAAPPAPAKGSHTHADGSTHEDHGENDAHAGEDDHAHDEVPLGKVAIGDLEVELAQGHGKVEAGKEGHLVVKLPYNDKGATIVRAWLGTKDRTRSLVGKGQYAASHDDYDIHAVAPDPLPENLMWWIEIEKPDGTKLVGSAKPLME